MRTLHAGLFALLLPSCECADKCDWGSYDTHAPDDDDGDGYTDEDDCDDWNEQANPGMLEVCDGLDNDCDAQIDEGVTSTYYEDVDGDGFGTVARSWEQCVPGGGVPTADDCDDADPSAFPGALEVCGDGVDQDCDGADAACLLMSRF